MFTEYHTHEIATLSERTTWNALKFGQSGEINLQEGWAHAEGLVAVPPNCSEVGAPQVEIDGAMGEAPIQQPLSQCPRTKLIFDIDIDDPFLN